MDEPVIEAELACGPTQQDGWFESFDGTRLYYEIEGTAGDIDLLLCDGIGCDGFIWRYLRPHLLDRGRIIHLHMRGHGRSDPPKDKAAVLIHHLADDWRALLDHLGCTRAVALGHSMGVQVALELAHRDGSRIEGLALLCGSFENPVGTFHDGRGLERILPMMRGAVRVGGTVMRAAWNRLVKLPAAFHVARMTEIHPDLARRRDFEPYLAHLSMMDPRLFLDMLDGTRQHSARPWLSQLNIPVLVVAGEQDRFTPGRLSREMADLLPQGELLMVEEGTHTAPIEHPTQVDLAVTDFLDTHFFALT